MQIGILEGIKTKTMMSNPPYDVNVTFKSIEAEICIKEGR